MTRAPGPPQRLRGTFSLDPRDRARVSVASGPFQAEAMAVACPADREDLAELLLWAAREGVSVIPRGGGTGMPGGNVGHGVVLDLMSWTNAPTPDRERRTVRVGPGVTGAEVEKRAARVGLFFPPLPSSADRCTIGGMVANNAAGARSFGYGAIRDWVEEMDVVLADGSLLTLSRNAEEDPRFRDLRAALGDGWPELAGWPAVRKNSSGYALDRFLSKGDGVSLFVGSEGTLGVVTSVLLRLTPQPESRALTLLPIPDVDALNTVVDEAETIGATACEFFAGRFLDMAELRTSETTRGVLEHAPAAVLLEVDGSDDDVEEGLDRISALAGALHVAHLQAKTDEDRTRLWSVRHAASPVCASRAAEGLVSMQFIEDSVVPKGALPDYLRGLEAILKQEETDAVVFGHAGDGNVHVNPLIDVRRGDWLSRVRRLLEATVELVVSLGGTLSGEHGDGRLRAPFHDRIWGSAVSSGFRAVKQEFDPQGLLNPGVVVALPGQDPLAGLSSDRRLP